MYLEYYQWDVFRTKPIYVKQYLWYVFRTIHYVQNNAGGMYLIR